MVWTSKYFYGKEISPYGLEHGYVDYATLASAFQHVLNNDIMAKTADIGYWESIGGSEFDEDGNPFEVFQWYIVSDNAVDILQEAGEIVYRNDELDLNVWGVTHWGTSWDYVLTGIEISL